MRKTITILALAAAGASACTEAASEPTALQTDALIAAAPDWTPSSITDGLAVDAATREQIDSGLRTLHASMLELHGRWEAAESLDGDAAAAATAALEADVRALHERHMELWNALDEDVREVLAERMHERLGGHHDAMAGSSLHERMKRLHGAVHDAAGGH